MKINNLINNGLKGPTLSKFLTIKEQQALNNKNLKIEFSNLYLEEERKRAFLYPLDEETIISFNISIISFDNSKFRHADCLGAIMALGLERDVIGDIIITDNKVFIIIADEIKKYLLINLLKVGNQYIKVEEERLDILKDIKKTSLTEEQIIVSSLRLDAVVASICKLSRSKSQEYISNGFVKINGNIIDKYDHFLKNEDYISIRKFGRTYIKDVLKKTRKDKLVVLVDRTN